MSTFLVSFGVVAATIAAVVHVVLNGPDQPPTIRRDASRAKAEPGRRRRRATPPPRQAATATAAMPSPGLPALFSSAAPALALPDSDIMRLRVQPSSSTTLWGRIRSAVALIVLVGVLGALLALAVGGLGLGLALLLRSATG